MFTVPVGMEKSKNVVCYVISKKLLIEVLFPKPLGLQYGWIILEEVQKTLPGLTSLSSGWTLHLTGGQVPACCVPCVYE